MRTREWLDENQKYLILTTYEEALFERIKDDIEEYDNDIYQATIYGYSTTDEYFSVGFGISEADVDMYASKTFKTITEVRKFIHNVFEGKAIYSEFEDGEGAAISEEIFNQYLEDDTFANVFNDGLHDNEPIEIIIKSEAEDFDFVCRNFNIEFDENNLTEFLKVLHEKYQSM